MIDASDLILTATVEHRSAVVTLQPLAMKKTFTLLEFARSAPAADPDILHLRLAERIPALAAYAFRARPRLRLAPDQIDIPDPYGYGDEVYTTAFTLIRQAVDHLSPILAES